MNYPARPSPSSLPAWSDCFHDWSIEPKANGWRVLIDQERMEVWNRKGKRSSLEYSVLKKVQNSKIKSRWLDCEWMGQRTKTGSGTLVIIDACEPMPYAERRNLFSHIEPMGFEVKSNALLRMPTYSHSKIKAVWKEMEFQNAKAGETIFEGFVMKKDYSYPWGKGENWETYNWQKQRICS